VISVLLRDEKPLDARTGDDSIRVNGQTRDIDEPFNDGRRDYQNPPNRPNDRETVVYINPEWNN
jgi:hypothetical protein